MIQWGDPPWCPHNCQSVTCDEDPGVLSLLMPSLERPDWPPLSPFRGIVKKFLLKSALNLVGLFLDHFMFVSFSNCYFIDLFYEVAHLPGHGLGHE